MTTAPRSFDDLVASIARRHADLPDRLQRIAEHAVQHPNDFALSTVSALAQRIGVQPSAIVRFANTVGYDGYSEMQQVFRARLVVAAAPSYRERITAMAVKGDGDARPARPGDVLAQFVSDDIAALERLYQAIPARRLERAVALLAKSQAIYVLAQGRSFPVAYYLDYALTRLDLKSHLLDGIGGLVHQRVRAIGPKDVLVIVSFKDYAPEVVRVTTEVAARGIPIVAVTDNPLSPVASLATVSLEIAEAKVRPFRSLVAPICLAQSIVVAVGHAVAGRNGDAR
jgi:DNA-binding MurR/RpiR family transcriptional regulator